VIDKRFKDMNEKIGPDEALVRKTKERMREEMKMETKTPAWKWTGLRTLAAVLVAALLFTATIRLFQKEEPGEGGVPVANNGGTPTEGKGVFLDKVELPDGSGSGAKMMPLIVYKGRVYIMANYRDMDGTDPESLKGELIGRTKGNLDEWSKQDDYAVNLASSVGEADVYTVKGYDDDFRIMTIEEGVGVRFFECVNGIWVANGEELFGKMKIRGNVEKVEYQLFADWDSGQKNYRTLDVMDRVDGFVDALYQAEFLEVIDEKAPDLLYTLNRAPLYLLLKDGTIAELMLFEGGYVKYVGLFGEAVFKMDVEAFNSIYEKMN
jgi:hypothetical protein